MIEIIRNILKVFSDNGLFNEGVELIGSWCFQLYQKHLGAKSFPLRTQDIDFLIPSPYQGERERGKGTFPKGTPCFNYLKIKWIKSVSQLLHTAGPWCKYRVMIF